MGRTDPKPMAIDDKALKKINIIRGQLNGVAEMIKKNRQCSEILVQLKAIRNATGQLGSLYASQYLAGCLKKKKKPSAEELEMIFKE